MRVMKVATSTPLSHDHGAAGCKLKSVLGSEGAYSSIKAVSDDDRRGQNGLYLHETPMLFATPHERIMSVRLK